MKTLLRPFKNFLLASLWRLKYAFARESFPKNAGGKTYLNLGAGDTVSKEFVNIDAVPFRRTHLIADIQNLYMFPDNSVDMVYGSHVAEHIPRGRLLGALREWNRVLKPGGVLRLGVPNFDSLVEIYHRSGNEVGSIVNQLLGQDGEYDDHHTIWNEAFAKKMLTDAGFTGIRSWNPATASHHEFRDKTNRVFTDEQGSVSISLNIEAVKN
ncbi:MAG: methyltransferase domain-containing protein [Minisyncoccia bacterium]